MSMTLKRMLAAVATLAAAGALLACPADDEDDPEEPSISVDDQTLEVDDADTVTIAEATIDNDGFAVIYDDDDGQPGDIIGASELIEEGDHSDFDAQLQRDADDGETMWATLHYDALDEGQFQFDTPAKQPQATDFDRNRVQDDFEVSVDEDPVEDELSLTIDDQTLAEDEADVITVAEAAIPDDEGFVVIYDEEDEDEFGDVLGASDLLEDETRQDFTIELDRDADDDETLWGRLHGDDTDAGQFDDEDDQPPLVDDDEQEVTDSFVVTIEEDPDPPEEPSISVGDQTLDFADGDLSTMVTVDEVDAMEDGFVAIHERECENAGTIIGVEAVDEGVTSDLDVELGEPAADEGAARDLCAMLHVDADDDGEFDPDEDGPAVDDDGEIVEDTFNVEVVEGTAAVRVTVGMDESPPRYTVDDVEPSLFADEFELDDNNNDVAVFDLRPDWRYEFDNTVSDDEPMEFINAEEEVLLSQEADDDDAPLEDVDSIDWIEDDDVFRFTVSDDFWTDTGVLDNDLDGTNVVTDYQSAASPNMIGPVQYRD